MNNAGEKTMTTTTTKKTVADFRADLEAAATKCGVSLEGLTVKWASFDRTWGDLDGWIFAGPQAERAAKFAKAWVDKYLAPRRNYDAQFQSNQPEACEMAIDNVGNVFTNRERVYDFDNSLNWIPAVKLVVVYYPCND